MSAWLGVLARGETYVLPIVLTAGAVGGSAWGLVTQAWATGGQRKGNVVILVAAYASVVSSSSLLAVDAPFLT
jgi:hypothetical protein